MFVCSDTDYCETRQTQVIAAAKAWRRTRRGRMADVENVRDNDQPLLVAEGLSKNYGRLTACRDVSFALYPGEGAGDRRRVGFGQNHAAATAVGAVPLRARDGCRTACATGVTRDLAALWRSRAPVSVSHRLGLCAPGPRIGPAHGGVGRRQCRRAA